MSFGITLFLSAPSSYFIHLFGAAKVNLFGNLISAAGLLASALLFHFSKELMQLHLVTFGVVFGSGQSLVYAASFAILPHYFNKKLGLAMGILNAGSCLLIIVTSLLMAQSLDRYGLFVTFLAMALLTFTCAFSSLTYKFRIPTNNKHKDLRKRFIDSLGLRVLKRPKFRKSK